MEEQYTVEAARERLILAGIRELEEHGLNDFSLRRVATSCELSCAAPYRHFRGKEELILEIIRYINRQWKLLQDQITSVFPVGDRRQPIEIGVAHIRFWIANPNFRSILLLDDPDIGSPRQRERKNITAGLGAVISDYCKANGMPQKREAEISYAYCALIYGTVLLLGNQELENSDATIATVRAQLEKILEK
ncbi:MAG: TetR/AcrR family transcriptional regulator [Clostridia bacterium]|nr:TetR/AcrR family transcriptional regulator [Clostridia bacterium]